MLWGYFLYQGVIDPLGGIWTLWPLFGTSNQMLAAIALILCTVVLFKMKRERFAWVTIVPDGVARRLHGDGRAGEGVRARIRRSASSPMRGSSAAPSAAGKVLAPAKILDEMSRVVFNDYLDATLAALFVAIVVIMVVYGVIDARKALGTSEDHGRSKSAPRWWRRRMSER